MVMILGLFSTGVKAQQALIVGRDSSLIKVKHFTRAAFLVLSSQDQMNLLNNPPFVVDDLINATATEMLLQTPGLVYLSAFKFYKQLSSADEQQVLRRPQMYKVYAGQ